MKKRNKIEIAVMGILLAVVIVIVSVFSSHQFSSHEVRVKNFFAEKKDTIDVVHIGASEMYAGFSPEYIWENYGITSYNLATAAAPMGLAKSQVQAAIEYQHPKLMVISMNGAVYNNKRAVAEGYTRMWIDNMPDSSLRNKAIDDLIKGDKLTYKFKVLKYHDNLARFVECYDLFKREARAKVDKRLLTISGIQGQACSDDRDLSQIVDATNFKEEKSLSKITAMQLYDLLNYLKENKIKNVIFVNMPRYYDEPMLDSKTRINKATKIIKKYGYEVYDFDMKLKEIGLDPKDDFYNPYHLNAIGQQKMSKYFYEKVLPNYKIKTRNYDEDVKIRWDENYNAYTKVYTWIEKTIRNKSEYKMSYDYRVVDHILAGTIDNYENTLIKKAKIRMEKDRKKERRKLEEWQRRQEEKNPLPKPNKKEKAKPVPPAQNVKEQKNV